MRRAQRLRGTPDRGWRALRSTGLPVLTDALDSSLALAASMDSRGFARSSTGHRDRRTGPLLAFSLVALAVGGYGLLAGGSQWHGGLLVVVGVAAGAAGTVVAGRGVRHTRYRPDRWGRAEARVVVAGVLAAAVLLLAPVVAREAAGTPAVPLLAFLVAALPALAPTAVAAPREHRPSGLAVGTTR